MEVSGQLYDSDRFTPREGAPGTRWDPEAGLDAAVKRKISNPCWD
jgi:hypothetical protein